MRCRGLWVALVFAAVACADPETTDDRGYTKAPLENPGLLVGGEPETPTAGMVAPNRPRVVERVETVAAAEAEDAAAEQVSLAPGVTQEQFDEGQELFGGSGGCQACHGPGGSGSQLGPNLTDDEWLHVSGADVDELADVITQGVPQPVEHPAPMPPMGGANLSADQVRAVAAYVASLAQG